nr:asparagine synthase (glutamine-hydrolyzing) [Kiloniella majae]
MCGIAGIFGRPDRVAVEAMTGAMARRGPDDHGYWEDAHVSLGQARLSIIDLTSAAHQPMVAEGGGVVITFNGEIYNYLELREKLTASGVSFTSHSDTEVILMLYLLHGDDFVDHLRGIFAIAIYDRRRGRGNERMVLVRDQFGIKPLLYARSGEQFLFASELKSLLASGMVAREIDPIAMRELLMMGAVYQPRTMLAGVTALPPAHRMIIDQSGSRIDQYWSLGRDRVAGLRDASYDEAKAAVHAVLEDSVSHQMIADVPVGAFLSGGIDSALLVAMMARKNPGNLKTISVGFGAEGAGMDETDDADLVARHLGTDHTRLEVSGADMLASIGEIGAALDQPSVDGVNSFFVSKAASRVVKVAVSGTGGDELFAGYPWFSTMQNAQIPAMSGPLARFARTLPWRNRVLDKLRRIDFTGRYSEQYRILNVDQVERLLHPDFGRGANGSRHHADLLERITELGDGTPLERVSALCLRGYTQNQLLRDIDAVSMHHSLEVRVPFLDTVVADTALSVSNDVKMRPDHDTNAVAGSYRETGVKRVLLDIGRDMLPVEFDNRTKRGFGMPFDSWLKGPLREIMADTLSSATVKNRGLFDPASITSLTKRHSEGSAPWPHVWLPLIVELWSQQVLDAPQNGT